MNLEKGLEKYYLALSLQRVRTGAENWVCILLTNAQNIENNSEWLFIRYSQVILE